MSPPVDQQYIYRLEHDTGIVTTHQEWETCTTCTIKRAYEAELALTLHQPPELRKAEDVDVRVSARNKARHTPDPPSLRRRFTQ